MSYLKQLAVVGLSSTSLLSSINAFGQENCKTERHTFIERADVKVWSTTICPNQLLPFHTHDYSRVLIPNETGLLKVIYQDGHTSEVPLIKETPIYLSKKQGLSPHQDLNPGPEPLYLTVIELRLENKSEK